MPGAARRSEERLCVVPRSAGCGEPGREAALDGARFARGFRGQRREQLAEALADFSPDERVALVRLLTKLADAWPQA